MKHSYFKFTYSIMGGRGRQWEHTKIDDLPYFYYQFATDGRWSAQDYRVANKVNEVSDFPNKWWGELVQRTQHPTTKALIGHGAFTNNQDAYEMELKEAILAAKTKLDAKWQKKFNSDFEKEFSDPIVKFVTN